MGQAALGLETQKGKDGCVVIRNVCYSRAVGRRGDGITGRVCSLCKRGDRATNDLDPGQPSSVNTIFLKFKGPDNLWLWPAMTWIETYLGLGRADETGG
jgi:hypothetical protein